MKLNFYLSNDENNSKIVVKDISGDTICEYICFHKKTFSNTGADIIKTTLLSWAMIDCSITEEMQINVPIMSFEEKYLSDNFNYCCKLYHNVYKYSSPKITYPVKKEEIKEQKCMSDVFYLGYTQGKDSTLCKKLLEFCNKTIEYYKVSYDYDTPADDGHIYCEIVNKEKYSVCSITGLKERSDIVSFQQADDIHVTFACPYVYTKENYGKYLVVGIPWDAIHQFSDGTSDLVPTESYPSIMLFEELLNNYGYEGFRVISPIASLHTYGVYSNLCKLIGIDELLKLDSCWDAYEYGGRPCGYCPKCQRLKEVFRRCFDKEYIEDVPYLDIESADFLFGSVYATELLDKMTAEEIMGSVLIDEYSQRFSGEFIPVLQQLFKLEARNTALVDYKPDKQTWNEIRTQLINAIGMDYSKLSDIKVNDKNVPFLPFEKYYKWNRNNKILNCFSEVEYYDAESAKWISVPLGGNGTKLRLNDNLIFRRYLKLISINR
ncbi:MAG: hypothetical protein GX567_05450 [Clostridia bacterium]|nr:hypothetical protein [Clostridia bacterium]